MLLRTYLDVDQATNVALGTLIAVAARSHLSFARLLGETKVVELPLQTCELAVTEVLVEDLVLEPMWVVNLDLAW
jgi:hypothetical protein